MPISPPSEAFQGTHVFVLMSSDVLLWCKAINHQVTEPLGSEEVPVVQPTLKHRVMLVLMGIQQNLGIFVEMIEKQWFQSDFEFFENT